MGDFATLRVQGLDKILTTIDKVVKYTPKRAEHAMYKLTARAADAARRICPVDTGNLKASIDNLVKWTFQGQIIGMVFTPVEYGIYVHFGTYKMPARPFMNAALEFIAQHAEEYFTRELKGGL